MLKYQFYLIILLASLLPATTYAEETSLQNLLTNGTEFISSVLIPFLFGIAFLFFVINVFQYFIIGGANEEGQKKAKSLVIYSLAAFIFLLIFYGLVNLLVGATGLGDETAPTPDYLKNWCDRQSSQVGPPTDEVKALCGGGE